MNDGDSLIEEVSSSVLRRTDLPFGLGRKGLEGGNGVDTNVHQTHGNRP